MRTKSEHKKKSKGLGVIDVIDDSKQPKNTQKYTQSKGVLDLKDFKDKPKFSIQTQKNKSKKKFQKWK